MQIFCCTLLYDPSSFAIILMGKIELVALLSLSSVIVVWLFLVVPWVCLQVVIMVFPDHTHLLFFMKSSPLFMKIWSFETIHCLNYNTQRQKRHTVTKDVKVNFLGFAFYGFIGSMKIMLFLAYILLLLSLACGQRNSQKI